MDSTMPNIIESLTPRQEQQIPMGGNYECCPFFFGRNVKLVAKKRRFVVMLCWGDTAQSNVGSSICSSKFEKALILISEGS